MASWTEQCSPAGSHCFSPSEGGQGSGRGLEVGAPPMADLLCSARSSRDCCPLECWNQTRLESKVVQSWPGFFFNVYFPECTLLSAAGKHLPGDEGFRCVCGRGHRAVLGSLGPGHQCVCLMTIIINKILGFDNHRSFVFFWFFLRAPLRLLKCEQKKQSPFIICEPFVGDSDSSERHPGKTNYCPW